MRRAVVIDGVGGDVVVRRLERARVVDALTTRDRVRDRQYVCGITEHARVPKRARTRTHLDTRWSGWRTSDRPTGRDRQTQISSPRSVDARRAHSDPTRAQRHNPNKHAPVDTPVQCDLVAVTTTTRAHARHHFLHVHTSHLIEYVEHDGEHDSACRR
jgi:hypothetical protein